MLFRTRSIGYQINHEIRFSWPADFASYSNWLGMCVVRLNIFSTHHFGTLTEKRGVDHDSLVLGIRYPTLKECKAILEAKRSRRLCGSAMVKLKGILPGALA